MNFAQRDRRTITGAGAGAGAGVAALAVSSERGVTFFLVALFVFVDVAEAFLVFDEFDVFFVFVISKH